MGEVLGGNPDLLEEAARAFGTASARLEAAQARLGGLISQAAQGPEPAQAYHRLAPITAAIGDSANAMKKTFSDLMGEALQQRRRGGGQRGRVQSRSGHAPSWEEMTPKQRVQYLTEQVERDRRWLEQTAEQLRKNGSPNYWFAKTYSYVTKEVIESVRQGKYANPEAVLLEEIGFTNIYQQNLLDWEQGDRRAVLPNWKVAFERAAALGREDWTVETFQRTSMIVPAARAHIEYDLPQVVARVYLDNFSDLPFASIKQDFQAMADIFPKAEAAMRQEIVDGTARFDPGRSEVLQDLGRNAVLPVNVLRFKAILTAEEIVNAHRAGIHDSAGIEQWLARKGVLPQKISGQPVAHYPWH